MTSLISRKTGTEYTTLPTKGDTAQDSPSESSVTGVPATQPKDEPYNGAKGSAGNGTLQVDGDHSVYVGPSHWSDVLHEVKRTAMLC